MATAQIGGIIPALITAYDDHGTIDRARNAAMIDRLIHDGVHGVFISGSTGEALLQTIDERRMILDHAVQTVAGRVAVIAHIGAMDTATTLDLTRHANALGVDAVCALTPLYYELAPAAHADYFRRIAEVSDVPVIAYHIPGRSGVQLSPSWFVDLAAERVIAGVKYTSTDLLPLVEIRRRTDPAFVVLNGSDEVLLGGLALGADGGIGSTYNAIPGTYLALYRAFQEGCWDEARALQDRANHVIDVMSRYHFLPFLRAVLGHRGVPMGESRGPIPALDRAQRDEIVHLVATDPVLSAALATGASHAAP